jgi:Leucine-rich repeat (LRR) protein
MGMYKSLKEALLHPEDCTVLKLTVRGKTLPEEIGALPNLRELYLEGSELTELAVLASWQLLRLFSLKAPRFQGSLAPVFQLKSLENLKTIDTPLEPLHLSLGHALAPLRFLTLKNAGLKALPLEFGEYGQLEELHLPENQLEGLPPTFTGLRRLKRLNLDHNAFTVFPDLLGQLGQLQHVSMDQNLFTDDEKARIQRIFHLTVQ